MIRIDEICNSSNTTHCDNEKCNQNIYELIGVLDSDIAEIKKLGYSNVPFVLISSVKFGKYICDVVSYLLSDTDLGESTTKPLAMIGLIIKGKETVVATITMLFYVAERIGEQKFKGHYGYECEYESNTHQIGPQMKTFPGKNKAVSVLIGLLSDDHLASLTDTI